MKIKKIKSLIKILKGLPETVEIKKALEDLSREITKIEDKKIASDISRRTITANKLKIGQFCKVYFTDSLCRVIDVDYSYGRTSIRLSHDGEVTSISRHTEVLLIENI